jgi:hypothetical protein
MEQALRLEPIGRIGTNHLVAQDVDVPQHLRAGCELVGALLGQALLRGRPVVLFAPDLGREDAHPPGTMGTSKTRG